MTYNVEQCIGNRLRCLSRIVDKDFRSSLKVFDITESQLSILFALTKLGKIEQGKIGEALVLERSTVSRNVKILERRGIITKSSDYRPEIELTTKRRYGEHQILRAKIKIKNLILMLYIQLK
jgi:DNA-binding MarR family transcriptional regulator